jgi:hypothetical protein
VADIQRLGTQGYHWVLGADMEACFDMIDHTALMGRIRYRVEDKRVVALVKAFLKAGIMTEAGAVQDYDTGTPQGGILSPLGQRRLGVLDEHVMGPWRPEGRWAPPIRVIDAVTSVCRRDGSCAMPTTWACWCTVTETTSRPFARTPHVCCNRQVSDCLLPRRGSCTWRMGSPTSSGSTSVET